MKHGNHVNKEAQYRSLMIAAAIIGTELSKDPMTAKPFASAVGIALELDSEIRAALELEEQP